jgi:pimeloyl-ACP methyl ester carboxylesterase
VRTVRPLAARLAAPALATAAIAICAAAPAAQAQIVYAPCGDTNQFACGHLTVPLDPTGGTPGALTLALRRHRAPVGEARSAIIALAGGPGQPALPFAEAFLELLGPIAATRDLIAFDQRGIGLSDPLSCHAFERPNLYHGFGALIEACAAQLGPTRSLYTTADSVADIEAIRQAGGYEKLVLYGTSYGTKLAEQYAQDHPGHVEALVLDSVVPPNGPEPLSRTTFAAIPRVLSQVCEAGACARTTRNPVADLTGVLARIAHGPLRGRVIDGRGNAHRVTISSNELVEILLDGDFSELLRAEFVTGAAAAARGDSAPLARLLAVATHAEGEGEDFDTPLYFATSCEEQDFPWSRAADPKTRIAQAINGARALGAGAFAPFTAANALDVGDIQPCAYWPFTTPAPVLDGAPLPTVPALILSGADDLRTPTANARAVAAEIPGSHLLVVPFTGHSVLTDETTPCASEALQAMFAGRSVRPCRASPPPPALVPPPLPPRTLAMVSSARGYGGLPGRTLDAVSLTLGDFVRQLELQLSLGGSAEAPATVLPTLRTGGLRAGWAEFAGGALRLHGYSYVPGMTLSGSISSGLENLRVGGSSAAHGTLRLGPHRSLVGTLGGRHVVLPATSPATAAIVGVDAVESPHPGSRSSRSAVLARRLAGILGGVQP